MNDFKSSISSNDNRQCSLFILAKKRGHVLPVIQIELKEQKPSETERSIYSPEQRAIKSNSVCALSDEFKRTKLFKTKGKATINSQFNMYLIFLAFLALGFLIMSFRYFVKSYNSFINSKDADLTRAYFMCGIFSLAIFVGDFTKLISLL